MQVISATEKQDIENILSEHDGVAVLLLYKQETQFDVEMLKVVGQLVQETGVPLIKVDVQKATYFSKSTNITQKPSLAVISKTCDNILDYRSEANSSDAKDLFQIAKQLKIGGIKNQQAILGKQYNVAKID